MPPSTMGSPPLVTLGRWSWKKLWSMRVLRATAGLTGPLPLAQSVRSDGGVTPGMVSLPRGQMRWPSTLLGPNSLWSMRLNWLLPLSSTHSVLPVWPLSRRRVRVSRQFLAASNHTATFRASPSMVWLEPEVVRRRPSTVT